MKHNSIFRQLWMVTDKRDEMLSLNVVRCVTILLTTECESIGLIKSTNLDNVIVEPGKSQEELIIGILKCLGYFTTYSVPKCAEQVTTINFYNNILLILLI